MSDDLTALRSHIPEYPGQNDTSSRRLSDQYVRAWLGERLGALRDRFPQSAVSDRLDDLILHCQFGDQGVIRAVEGEHFADPDVAARLDAQDLLVVVLAERAASVTGPRLAAYVGEVEATVKQRVATILAL